MADRRSLWTHNPIFAGNIKQGELDVTPGQVGVNEDFATHSITNEPSEYEPMPVVATAQPFWQRSFRGRQSSTGSFQPWLLRGLDQDSQPAGITPAPVSTQAQGLTGAPLDPEETQEHGPVTREELHRRTGQHPKPQEPFWKRLKPKERDSNNAFPQNVVPQLGANDPAKRRFTTTDAAIALTNTFQLPNPRQTFDTPMQPGITVKSDGTPYEGKAGYPLTAKWDESSVYKVDNGFDPVIGGALAFMADRVRAGAANPADPSQTRPAKMPHWQFFRPFDKGIAERLTAQKGVVQSPQAARPIQTTVEETQTPGVVYTGMVGGNARRAPAPGMTPISVLPNNARDVPQPWDYDLNVNGGSSVVTSARRWGLR